jgi:hypothetical protein
LAGCLTQTFAPPPAPDAPTPTVVRRAFVTDNAFASDFGGLRAADALCQGEADAAALRGTWLAWLADDTGDPATRFNTSFMYVRLDGVIIAGDFGELAGGNIQNPITTTPTGQVLSSVVCWTNVAIGGHAPVSGVDHEGPANCGNWTSRDRTQWGDTGSNNLTSGYWTLWGAQTCDTNEVPPNHLYCFEQ